eukprot:TRINITY_DN5927_c0_g3_i1.p1 TRINITY_DN5927_c0_g3~~TRINITY_DN5927_c0_g3_i1.p1  ORF type:complete len:542 (+),score=150.45 TRINITY_DN5927_c0_g3_i1:43-1668(+)
MPICPFHDTPIPAEGEAVSRYLEGLAGVRDLGGLEDVYGALHGPLQALKRGDAAERLEAAREYMKAEMYGMTHHMWEEYIARHGGGRWDTNFIVPVWRRDRKGDRGALEDPYLRDCILLSNPEDCVRIAAEHVEKQGNFAAGFFSSVISVRDVGDWKRQRDALAPAFLPASSLRQRFPISNARAAKCVEKLMAESGAGRRDVDMNEFLLHETYAQLRLGLFGDAEGEMEALNKVHRDAMSGLLPDSQGTLKKIYGPMVRGAASGGGGPICPHIMPASGGDRHTLLGNISILSFAGHDTTGHTLTWLLYELARNPGYQKEVQAEADGLAAALEREGRALAYADLKRLPFMTRCVMETLRLWPAVANGTFRVLQRDDWVTGIDGARVAIPKGAFVQVLNWTRHRSPELWGADAALFNPHRGFAPHEVWNDEGFGTRNPGTPRFAPFTHAPRDCLGKNFSQMEMRAILFHLLRAFTFTLPPQAAAPRPGGFDVTKGINYGTLAPADPRRPFLAQRDGRVTGWVAGRLPSGLHLRPVPRRSSGKL